MYYFLNFFIISKKSVSWTPFFEDLKPLAKEKKNLTMNHLQARACHFPQLLLLEGNQYIQAHLHSLYFLATCKTVEDRMGQLMSRVQPIRALGQDPLCLSDRDL